MDISVDVAEYHNPEVAAELKKQHSFGSRPGGTNMPLLYEAARHPLQPAVNLPGQPAIESDVPQGLGQHLVARCPGEVLEGGQDSCEGDEDEPVSKLFPNSFKVTGIKHVCDNALSSLLVSLPQSLWCVRLMRHDST